MHPNSHTYDVSTAPADEAVEFVQFATLALQAHPFLLRTDSKGVGDGRDKGRTGDLVVENLDCFLGMSQQRFIVLFCFLVGVDKNPVSNT